MVKNKTKTPTDFGDAGVVEETFGKNGQFKRRKMIPWICQLQSEPSLEFYAELGSEFCIIESICIDGRHTATIIDEKTGSRFEINISHQSIVVYPTENNHHEPSERLLNLIEQHGGILVNKTKTE